MPASPLNIIVPLTMSTPGTARIRPSARRKACIACSDAKVRCDRSQSRCLRCRTRGVACIYPGSTPRAETEATAPTGDIAGPSPAFLADTFAAETPQPATPLSQSLYTPAQPVEPPRDHYNSDPLICNVDATAIETRWLNYLVSGDNDRPKVIPPGTIVYIRAILKSYVSMVVSGLRLPPFIHHTDSDGSVVMHPILAQCCSLLRILSVRTTRSDGFSSELLEREMARIFADYASYDNKTMLSAFQAYLIYTMALYFMCGQSQSQALRQNLMNLQQLAGTSVSQGITTAAEMNENRPEWRSWILAESKRRTLYVMYLFDNLLCANDSYPVLVAVELTGLLAPASRSLWEAKSVGTWTKAYHQHMASFNGGGLSIHELWSLPSGCTQVQISSRRERVDSWVQDLDTFGTTLFAITTASHGH